MTTEQKIKKARELVKNEEDGSTYLQSVCTIKELTEALAHKRQKLTREIIEDAITIRKHNNEVNRGKYV